MAMTGKWDGKTWEGIFPSVCVIYTDKSCKQIDYDAYREHLRKNMLTRDIGALVVGGHAGETECLSMEERLKVIKIAQEEAKGRVPVVGGVISDSTWDAIKQGKIQKDAGVDGVLFMPPQILIYDPVKSDDFIVEHVKKFDKEVNLPFIFFGSSLSIGGTYEIHPKTFKKMALAAKNLVAWKITCEYNLAVFIACMNALREAEQETGRHVAALSAGEHILAEILRVGGDGNLNGGENYRAPEDVEVFKAVKRGDLLKAIAIQDKLRPITDAVRGVIHGWSNTPFHYRYKVAAWLRGYIPRPHMRLPQLPIPKHEVETMRKAMIQSGLEVVREAEELEMANT
jgi:4-hydroxy-tetrahydrodipicolinate synthase